MRISESPISQGELRRSTNHQYYLGLLTNLEPTWLNFVRNMGGIPPRYMMDHEEVNIVVNALGDFIRYVLNACKTKQLGDFRIGGLARSELETFNKIVSFSKPYDILKYRSELKRGPFDTLTDQEIQDIILAAKENDVEKFTQIAQKIIKM